MKCIYCATDSTYKERSDHRCKKCKRAFAFEPKDMPATFVLTDPAFKKAIEVVSENNTLFFTPRQLYYQLLRSKNKAAAKASRVAGVTGCIFGSIFLAVFGVIFAMSALKFSTSNLALLLGTIAALCVTSIVLQLKGASGCVTWLSLFCIGGFVVTAYALKLAMPLPVLIIGGPIIVALLIGLLLPRPPKGITLAPKAVVTYDYFIRDILSRWLGAHGAPPRMLPDGGRLRPPTSQGGPEADIHSYSFDRLLVCDRAEIADMLLANNLHFETNTPIVSVEGYPQDIFPKVLEMVRRNPNLKVFALHDASPEGAMLALRLRESASWFPNPAIPIYDIGLRPRQVAGMPGLVVNRLGLNIELPAELNRNLSQGERSWLKAGYVAELASFKPARLMRAIYQNYNKAYEEDTRLKLAAENDPRGFFQTNLPGVRPALVANPGYGLPATPPSGANWPQPDARRPGQEPPAKGGH